MLRAVLPIGKLAPLLLSLLAACGSSAEEPADDDTEGALVGGVRESAWPAAGYLARADGSGKVLCGATLVGPSVVVTAAHCAYRYKDTTLAFGTGDLDSGRRIPVLETHYHPKAHPEAEGFVDLVHALRLDDLAYLILDAPVPSVKPARLASEPPDLADCDTRIIGYGQEGADATVRKSVRGCVVLKPEIAGDAIIEIRPHGGAVCHEDGDEGHAAIASDGTLVGIYVGSVTQSHTDCERHLQLLNGYEDVAGHADFFSEAVAQGARVHGR
jgi:hypothetical protein